MRVGSEHGGQAYNTEALVGLGTQIVLGVKEATLSRQRRPLSPDARRPGYRQAFLGDADRQGTACGSLRPIIQTLSVRTP